MGPWVTSSFFLNQAVAMNIDNFVDWAAGTTSFDDGAFAQLLEFSNMFPHEPDQDMMVVSRGPAGFGQDDAIATGRQIMSMAWISDFLSIQINNATYGGEIVYKGFPTEGRNGNVLEVSSGLSMSSSSSNKQGAWEFMRTILTEDWQRTITFGFPTNRAVFNEMLEEQMTPQFWTDEDGNEIEISQMNVSIDDGNMIQIFAMTQEEADQLLALIDSVSGISRGNMSLMEIIGEGASDFFSGRSSAQETARIVQNRASIFIAEQS